MRPTLPSTRVALALAGCIVFSPTADATDVFVPSFWDPHHTIEKPELSSLRSLRFLTEDDFPPFHFALPDGTLAGFDIDLARAICDELKISCTIQARRFDTLIPSLAEDQGDALVAALRLDTKARAGLDFTLPYLATPARFVAPTTTPLTEATPETLAGKTVGVMEKSAHEAYLEAFFPKTVRRPYASRDALREALAKGEIDALFGDGLAASLWLQAQATRPCCRFLGGPFIDWRFFGEGLAIGVRKGNGALRRALDHALASLAARGVYTDLYLKYFPLGFF